MLNFGKKICYVFFGLIVCLLFTNNVMAAEFDFTLGASVSGGNNASKGQEKTVFISLKSDKAIGTCRLKIVADNTLEFVSMKGIDNWTVLESNGSVLLENSNLDKTVFTSAKNVMSLNYKVNGNGKITISTERCLATDESEGTHDDVVVNLVAKEGTSNGNTGSSSSNSSNNTGTGGSNQNTTVNPNTGGMAILVLSVLLVVSFVFSFICLKKVKVNESK